MTFYESGAVPAVYCDPAADGWTSLRAPLDVRTTDKRARRILPVDLNSILGRQVAVNPQVSDRGESCRRQNYYEHKTERLQYKTVLCTNVAVSTTMKKCSCVATDKLAAYLLPS